MNSFPSVTPIVIASHPRSGTHLVIGLLRRHFPACQIRKSWGEPLDRLYCNIDELMREDGRLTETEAVRILSKADAPIVKTHSFPAFDDGFFEDYPKSLPESWTEWLNERAIFIYVHRKPCDVMKSYRLFRAGYEAESRVTFSDFLRASHDDQARISRWADHVSAWVDRSDVLAIQFSEVLNSTDATLSMIENHIGMSASRVDPLLPSPFSSIWSSRFARLFKTFPESTAVISRGGSVNERVSSKDIDYIRNTCGDLLLRLGYHDLKGVDSSSQ